MGSRRLMNRLYYFTIEDESMLAEAFSDLDDDVFAITYKVAGTDDVFVTDRETREAIDRHDVPYNLLAEEDAHRIAVYHTPLSREELGDHEDAIKALALAYRAIAAACVGVNGETDLGFDLTRRHQGLHLLHRAGRAHVHLAAVPQARRGAGLSRQADAGRPQRQGLGGRHPAGVLGRAGGLPLAGRPRRRGAPLTLPFRQQTYAVSELCAELRELLGEAYAGIWVSGEVQRLRPSRRGHLYFELIEKGAGDEVLAKLEAVAWSRDFARIRRSLARDGQELAEGHEIRCRCDLDFYPPFGRLQLVVREVDPTFSLGLLARRRRETLAALEAAGLLELNKRLPMPTVPLRIVLVTSDDSAAYHDFVSTLGESGYGFRVLLLHAAVQGRTAEAEIASALGAVAGLEADCVVLVRGGGSRTDLAVFDSRRVAEAVARCPLPVITGLGHETDQAIADLVAHTALKTPTKAAEMLIETVRRAEAAVAVLGAELPRAARELLGGAREWLGAVERGLGLSRFRLRAAAERRHGLAGRVAAAARRRLRRESERAAGLAPRLGSAAGAALARRAAAPGRLGGEIVAASRARLREASARTGGWARLVRQLAPERTLERGFTITRDAAGKVVREAGRLRPGDRLMTSFADGTARSRVEDE